MHAAPEVLSHHRPTVVLLHAFPLDLRQFEPQLNALKDEYNVFGLDLPGFGGSPFDSHLTIERMAAHVQSTLTTLQTGPVVLGGVSLGGYVALGFTRQHPQALSGLILADTRAEPDSDEARAKREENIQFVEEQGSAALVEKMLPSLLGESTRRERPDVVEMVRQIGSEQTVEALIAGLAALRDRPDATGNLAHIPVPTLVVRGEEDAVTPLEAMRAMADALPHGEFVAIPRAGHLSNLEAPDEFNFVVREFLGGLNL